jgi:hypothetical protein
MVRELPRWHRRPDMLSRTVINTQDSRLCPRAYVEPGNWTDAPAD